MVGRPAAGEKKRGRPRKKRKERPPIPLPPAPPGARPQAPPPPAPTRRSHRRRRPPRMDDYADYGDEDDFYYELPSTDEEVGREEAEDDEEESEGAERNRRERKFKLLQKLPNHHHRRTSSSSSSEEGDGARGRESPKKGRDSGAARGGDDGCEGRGGPRRDGSGSGSEEEGGGEHAASKCDYSASGRMTDQGKLSTPLPDKKVLEAVLDKLQKKDTYGVYAEPVDPEELPDYHDIIKHPMDFGTIRKKLATSVYCNLEQFESDVFLVCTNAMQYNAPDTIYFRQARSIQELARKKFQSIRFYSEDALRSEHRSQSNSVSGKIRKRSLCKSAHIPGGSDTSLAATCISTDDACGTGHDAEQPCPAEQPVSVNGFIDGSLTCENKSEKGDDHSAKSSPVKLERKMDMSYEDRRTTYDVSDEQHVAQSDPVFATFESEQKQLVAVGLDTQYSYARSLARFAGTLGPIAWKIASEKIEKALPEGIKFGPGWVGEYEPLPTPVLSFENLSGCSEQFQCKMEYGKERTKENGLKYVTSVTRKGLQLDSRGPSDSSVVGVTNGKVNHLELSCGSLDQSSDGSQPMIMNATFRQYKPSEVASARDCKTKVGTNISSLKSETFVDVAARRSGQCLEATASRVPEVTSGRSKKRSETFKQSDSVACQSQSTSSTIDKRGLSSGKDAENFGGSGRQSIYSGFIPTDQIRISGNCFSYGGPEQTISDPIELMRSMPGRKMVDDNPKQLMSTVSLPRSNYVTAVPTAAPVWMSVKRSSKQKLTQASDHLKMQGGAASHGNSSSEPLAYVSGFHENSKGPTPSVPQLPNQAVVEERWVQNKGLTVFPQFITTELSRSRGQTPWQGLAPHVQKQTKDVGPPDLNITFRAPRSPVRQSSGILVDSQQPDLALQL